MAVMTRPSFLITGFLFVETDQDDPTSSRYPSSSPPPPHITLYYPQPCSLAVIPSFQAYPNVHPLMIEDFDPKQCFG